MYSDQPPGRYCVVNLREKFSPEQGFESRSPALRVGALASAPPRRIAELSQNISLSRSPLSSGPALVPSVHNGREYVCSHYFN